MDSQLRRPVRRFALVRNPKLGQTSDGAAGHPANVGQDMLHSPIAFVGAALATLLIAAPVVAQAVNPGCRPGFVWRDAKDGDGVCVTPQERQVAKQQNANAANNVQSGGGNTCRQGYVWRDAWDGDGVCVTPSERDQAELQNQMSAQRSNPVPAAGQPTPLEPPPENQRCATYARSAVGDYKDMRYYATMPQFRKCLIPDDPRWTADYGKHYQWCLTARREWIIGEWKARDDHLVQCGVRHSL
jgi:hypothetical protein